MILSQQRRNRRMRRAEGGRGFSQFAVVLFHNMFDDRAGGLNVNAFQIGLRRIDFNGNRKIERIVFLFDKRFGDCFRFGFWRFAVVGNDS